MYGERFIVYNPYCIWSGSGKINLLAGLLQEAGLQGEIKVACGVEALGCLFGLKRYQSVISGFSYHSGADRNISLSIRWMVKDGFEREEATG